MGARPYKKSNIGLKENWRIQDLLCKLDLKTQSDKDVTYHDKNYRNNGPSACLSL